MQSSYTDMELNAVNHPWTYQVSYVFPPSSLITLVLSKFLEEHLTGQLRHLILVATYWMEVSCLPTLLNMLEDILHWYPLTEDVVKDVSVRQVLWLLIDMCCAYKGSLPQSVMQWQGQLMHL